FIGQSDLDLGPRQYLVRNVAKVADDSVTTVGKRNSIDSPLVVLLLLAVDSELRAFRRMVGLPRLERAPEPVDDFVGVLLAPLLVHELSKVRADKVRHIA